VIVQLGSTHEELSGSEWAHVVHGHLGGRPPAVNLPAEQNLAVLLRDLVGTATSAHDLSDGGLAQALAEAAMIGGVGARVELEGDAFLGLFAESAARAIVTVPADAVDALMTSASHHGVPAVVIGRTGGDVLEVAGQFSVPLSELRDAWSATLPAALGR
jgi:phosphoribosylformylglycinamidine synthase